MNTITRRAAFALLVGLLATPALQAANLEGRWRLVDQRAGSGRANLASPEAPLRLEFYLAGPALAGRIWTAETHPRIFAWPSFLTDRDSLPIQIDRLVIAPAGDVARAVYRVKGPGGDEPILKVEEEYRVAEGGGALVGTVKVTSLERGSPQGSYLLHRRFEREP